MIESSIKYLESRKQGRKSTLVDDKIKHKVYLDGLKIKEEQQTKQTKQTKESLNQSSSIDLGQGDVIAVSKKSKEVKKKP